MLAGLFRSNQPAVLFVAPLLVVFLLLPTFSEPAAPQQGLMPLSALVEHLLGSASWPRHLLAILLVVALAVQLTSVVNGLELMDRRNHLVALLFPVLLAGLGGVSIYEPALLGMPLVLFALRRTWSISNTGGVLGVLFDSGFLLGIASLCYLPYAFVLVVVWASVSVIRPFAWREYILPTLGLALVFYLAWAMLNLMDRTPWQPLLTITRFNATAATMLHPTAARAGFWSITGLVLLVAIMAFFTGYARSVMRGKNLRSSFLAFTTALGVLAVLLGFLNRGFPSVLAATPLAVLCSYALLTPKRPWLAEVSVLLMVGLALWVRWGSQ
ncbi:MAG: hypothetical protein KA941_10800 [Flavobacteriales bacterium]|nr:hypothetical protein [Flavobacteriales bacterium]